MCGHFFDAITAELAKTQPTATAACVSPATRESAVKMTWTSAKNLATEYVQLAETARIHRDLISAFAPKVLQVRTAKKTRMNASKKTPVGQANFVSTRGAVSFAIARPVFVGKTARKMPTNVWRERLVRIMGHA